MRTVKPCGAWVVGLCAVAALAVPASAGAITSAECAARVNDTPSKLVECIQQGDLSSHMDNLQAIANANPGPTDIRRATPVSPATRRPRTTSPRRCRTRATTCTCRSTSSTTTPTPASRSMSVGGTDLVLGTDWGPGQSLGSMDGQTLTAVKTTCSRRRRPELGGRLRPVGLRAQVSGHPVLIQRGTCTFAQKVATRRRRAPRA